MGICVGLQALFETSEESSGVSGLGLIPGHLKRFDDRTKSVPHIGWNSADNVTTQNLDESQSLYGLRPDSKYYYVHSYAAPYEAGVYEKQGWSVATAQYGDETFIGAIARENILATQFHPEKSGAAGLRVLRAFLHGDRLQTIPSSSKPHTSRNKGLTRRIIACLDVRANDQGDLVVTKGDQYDVRKKSADAAVRNLGKPVTLAQRYYDQGADEVTFLNITSFRDAPIADQPMLEVLRQTSATVFVPLTIGGGIRDTLDPATGKTTPALEIAKLYFQSGADKVSIGSDAVLATEEYLSKNKTLSGKTAIETISKAYGNQAVVVSVDPKRIYVVNPNDTSHATTRTATKGPNGEEYIWYACTIHGGRKTTDIDVVQLVSAVQDMGAGEILLNCIDRDGTNAGFDLELMRIVKAAVKIPVIASSGAGNAGHFREVFVETGADAALGAGIFHRGEWTVAQVKEELERDGLVIRRPEQL